jgi:predicted nucleic acid-binding protein
MRGVVAGVDLEVLYSSRNLVDYEEILEERRSLDAAPITPEVMATAIDLQHELARRGQHRVPIPDLMISAAALVSDLVVLHYDADFERIADAGARRMSGSFREARSELLTRASSRPAGRLSPPPHLPCPSRRTRQRSWSEEA